MRSLLGVSESASSSAQLFYTVPPSTYSFKLTRTHDRLKRGFRTALFIHPVYTPANRAGGLLAPDFGSRDAHYQGVPTLLGRCCSHRYSAESLAKVTARLVLVVAAHPN